MQKELCAYAGHTSFFVYGGLLQQISALLLSTPDSPKRAAAFLLTLFLYLNMYKET